MRKSRVLPAVLIAGFGFLGSLAGPSPGQAQDWICQELQGSQCFYPSDIFCFWSEEEVGACNCQEESGTYTCHHIPPARAASAGASLPAFLASLKR
jgi:hypothetical protein